MFDLSGKTAILTGSKGNLGPILMQALKEAGCIVEGIDLREKYPFDVTNYNDVNSVAKIRNDIPDIIINNAAIDHPPSPGVDFWTDYKRIIETNLIGAANVTRAFLPDMIGSGKGGVIINVGSIQGNVAADWRNYEDGFEKPVGYNLSKAGLIQLTRSIAVQYGKYGIRSVCISFAAVDTGKFQEPFASKFKSCLPLGRFISPESLKMTLLYACCCPELTGQQILVDAGYTAW